MLIIKELIAVKLLLSNDQHFSDMVTCLFMGKQLPSIHCHQELDSESAAEPPQTQLNLLKIERQGRTCELSTIYLSIVWNILIRQGALTLVHS